MMADAKKLKASKPSRRGAKTEAELAVDELVGKGETGEPKPASSQAPAEVAKPQSTTRTRPVKPVPSVSRPNGAGSGYRPSFRPSTRPGRTHSLSSFQVRGGSRQIPDAHLPTEFIEGPLEVVPEGNGFIHPDLGDPSQDVYVSSSQMRRFRLRPGDKVGGQARKPKETERYWGLLKVETVNDISVVEHTRTNRPKFYRLTPIYPKVQLRLEYDQQVLSTRLIDLVAPVGRGQRGLIVSPPKAGKTTILKEIAKGIAENHKEVVIMAVLVGERPEEVTDISRSINGEVFASNFDEPPERQTRMAEMGLERARRQVELGQDVVILLDSITRLARAYNLAIPSSGRTLSGGFDPVALYPPKRFFGAARCFEEGGSLTIIGTALIDTGSKMDELIYEEFKGTGNMELHLDRRLAERRIFPAIDIRKSGTRKEELLFDAKTYEKIQLMRRMIDMLGADERTELFAQQVGKNKTNADFLKTLKNGGK